MKRNNILYGYIFAILSAVIFGLMPLMTQYIKAEGVNSVSLVFWRNIFSVPMLLVLALRTKEPLKTDLKTFGKISLVAIMGCCLTPLLLFESYGHIASGTATVIHFIYPAVVVVGEFIFFKSKMKAGQILSVILCIIGIALFYNPEDKLNPTGSFYALLSGFTYATYVISLSLIKKKQMPVFKLSFYVASICSVIMLCVCILTKQLTFPTSVFGWALTIFFAFALNVGAVVLFQRGTFLIGGGKTSVLSTLEPVTSVLAGALVFQEKLNTMTIIGTILVISASILIASGDLKKKKES